MEGLMSVEKSLEVVGVRVVEIDEVLSDADEVDIEVSAVVVNGGSVDDGTMVKLSVVGKMETVVSSDVVVVSVMVVEVDAVSIDVVKVDIVVSSVVVGESSVEDEEMVTFSVVEKVETEV